MASSSDFDNLVGILHENRVAVVCVEPVLSLASVAARFKIGVVKGGGGGSEGFLVSDIHLSPTLSLFTIKLYRRMVRSGSHEDQPIL